MKFVLAATVTLSIGAPVGAAYYVQQRTDELADKLGAAAGVEASIGGVDADLTGTVRLSDVRLGSLVTADSIEGSTSLESLLDGTFGADEIRVAGPHLAIEVDANGDSDLARVARRLAARRAPSGASETTGRARRVVVSGGSVVAHVANLGDVSADDVELVPDDGGVRVITGRVRVRAQTSRAGTVSLDLAFARGAADLALPRMKLGRMLAVGGTGDAKLGDRDIPLRDVAAGRLATGSITNPALEVRASLDDGGVPRQVAAAITSEPGADGAGHLAVTVRGDRVPLRALGALAPRGLDLDGARGSGSLTIHHGATSLRLELDGSIDGARFDHAAIAATPMAISAAVKGALDITPDAITVGDTAITVGQSHWTVAGWLRRGADPVLRTAPPNGGADRATQESPIEAQLDVRLAPAACNDLLASLPSAMRGPLDGMSMSGTLGGHARLAIDLSAPVGDGTELTTELDGGCTVVTEPPGADVTALAGITEHAYPDGTSAKVGPGLATWVELHRLPSYVGSSFIAAEDALFWEHHGFDLHQIAKSLEIDLRERRLLRGGSTISQQLVKNVFLSQRRSADRKLQEAILTWRLEERLDKKAILERYLNVIELGPRVFGLDAAAKYWFGMSPYLLNLKQAAFLAALTSEPATMSRRVRRAGGVDTDSGTRIDIVLRAMNVDNFIDSDTMYNARLLPMGFAATALERD